MAITVNGGGTSGRRRFHGTSALSEINVTPFVDVVLVLLIIFMMTAHVMEFGIEVDVPKTKPVQGQRRRTCRSSSITARRRDRTSTRSESTSTSWAPS